MSEQKYRLKQEFTESEVETIMKCLDTDEVVYGRMKGVVIFDVIPDVPRSVRLKLKPGEEYYVVGSTGEVSYTEWENTEYGNQLRDYGNCFPTREAAESAAKKIKELLLNL